MPIRIVLLLLFAAALVWLVWPPPKEEEGEPKRGSSRFPAFWRNLTNRTGRRKEVTSKNLNEWLIERVQSHQSSADEAQLFTDWLGGLSERQAELFRLRLSAFWSSMNLDPAWLADEELSEDLELQQGVERAAVLASLAYAKADAVQDNVTVLSAYRAWERKPNGRRQRKFGRELFSALIEADIVAAPPPAIFLDSKKTQEGFIADAIRTAAEQDRYAFNDILLALLASAKPSQEAAQEPADEVKGEAKTQPELAPKKRTRKKKAAASGA